MNSRREWRITLLLKKEVLEELGESEDKNKDDIEMETTLWIWFRQLYDRYWYRKGVIIDFNDPEYPKWKQYVVENI